MGSKLGIIFAFLLSVAAAGGSYYLYQGWVEERTVRGSVETKYDQVKTKYDQVKEERDIVRSEKDQLKAKSEEYRTKAEAMQSQLGKLQSEQSRIDFEKTALENQLKSHQGMIGDLQKQVAELAKKAKDAQAACGVTPADLKADFFSSPKPFTGVTTSGVPAPAVNASGTQSSSIVFKPVTSVGSSVSTVSTATVNAEETPQEVPALKEESSITTESSPPTSQTSAQRELAPAAQPVQSVPSSVAGSAGNGKVLTVNRKFNFVVINQGLQDGFKMGDKLKVLKQGQGSATIQIEKLYDKFSAATLLEEDPKQQVVEGDEIRKI